MRWFKWAWSIPVPPLRDSDNTIMEGVLRQDVKEAKSAVGRIRGALVYKDVDELDIGMQKVQPLPYLDEEIKKFKEQIAQAAAEQGTDDVPGKLLSKVDHVIQVATDGMTTLFKASELLEFTFESFLYARRVTKDSFKLTGESSDILDQFDQLFSQMMKARLETNMELAEDKENQALDCLEKAVREAERDCRACLERVAEEASQLESVGRLEDVREAVRESINDEISELEMIRDQCAKDARTIDSELKSFEMRMGRVITECKDREQKQRRQLSDNRQKQEELRKKLAELEEEEKRLAMELSAGESSDQEVAEARAGVSRDIGQWKEKIVELEKRANTSLRVMREMSEVTELIVSDAQQKQSSSSQKMSRLELQSLLGKRDTLLAQGVMFRLIETYCQDNISSIEAELVRLKTAKKQAAMANFPLKVKEASNSIESYSVASTKYEDKRKDAQQRLEAISKELSKVDERISKLKPSVKLDKLADRYAERKRLMDKVFADESTEGIVFHCKGNYII